MEARAREPNPEAIAWYLGRSERLLDDLHDRVQSLRSRGAQLAGFSAAVLALVGANAASMVDELPSGARQAVGFWLLAGALLLVSAFVSALLGTAIPNAVSDISAREAANYSTDRFIFEPDLWRVQLRTIRALLLSIDATTRQGDGLQKRCPARAGFSSPASCPSAWLSVSSSAW